MYGFFSRNRFFQEVTIFFLVVSTISAVSYIQGNSAVLTKVKAFRAEKEKVAADDHSHFQEIIARV